MNDEILSNCTGTASSGPSAAGAPSRLELPFSAVQDAVAKLTAGCILAQNHGLALPVCSPGSFAVLFAHNGKESKAPGSSSSTAGAAGSAPSSSGGGSAGSVSGTGEAAGAGQHLLSRSSGSSSDGPEEAAPEANAATRNGPPTLSQLLCSLHGDF